MIQMIWNWWWIKFVNCKLNYLNWWIFKKFSIERKKELFQAGSEQSIRSRKVWNSIFANLKIQSRSSFNYILFRDILSIISNNAITCMYASRHSSCISTCLTRIPDLSWVSKRVTFSPLCNTSHFHVI